MSVQSETAAPLLCMCVSLSLSLAVMHAGEQGLRRVN